MTEELNRAPVTPCPECPWRVSNQGLPVPDKDQYEGMFDRPVRVEFWSGIRSTVPTIGICHMSSVDPVNPHGADPDWVAMGYQAVPPHARARECGGHAAAGLRELRRITEAGSWEEYQRLFPHGFTREAAAFWQARLRGDRLPGFPPLRDVAVDDSEIIDPAAEEDLSALDLLTTAQMSALASIFEQIRGTLAAEDSGAAS
jgi:hypothetical protein